MVPDGQRREVLNWFHLMENLAKVGGSLKRLNQAQALFVECKRKQARNFCQYLHKHRHRIINYEYYQAEQICINDAVTIQLVPGQ